MLPLYWLVAIVFAPKVVALDGSLFAFAYGSFLDYPVAFSTLCPVEGEAKKVKGIAFLT